jgi:hypothetical protein
MIRRYESLNQMSLLEVLPKADDEAIHFRGSKQIASSHLQRTRNDSIGRLTLPIRWDIFRRDAFYASLRKTCPSGINPDATKISSPLVGED